MPHVEALEKTRRSYQNASSRLERRIVVCAGTGCVSNGSLEVYKALVKSLRERNIPVITEFRPEISHERNYYVSKSGCQGFCQLGPLVQILPDQIFYCRVRPENVETIIEKTIMRNEIVRELLYRDPASRKECIRIPDIPFYAKQHRYTLALCGLMNPEDPDEYIARGGYEAAARAVRKMTSEEICQTILDSGLRGRGGGGFPTGKKWLLTLMEPSDRKYVICNGDEGDPGAFMDRSIMEGNPHSVIEGMIIAAKAIQAQYGYVYVRAEYPLAVQRMKRAVEDARRKGLLGNHLFGTDFSFDMEVMEGAGAFVCGEETALIRSIEGNRGMPSPKPPYPAQKGLFGKPTVINNVETLATVPLIIRDGVHHFRSLGTPKSPGTKTFALTGHVANTGLIEVPFGTTLRQIIFEIGGGVTDDQGNILEDGFKAVQIGGPSGGCLTREHLDVPLDFDSLNRLGAMVGSGGLVVMNQSTCMVQVARFFMQFTVNESCGKCVPCREGTRQMLMILDDITEGKATPDTLILLEKLANTIKKGSLCGLGKTAPNPVLSAWRFFREEIEAHVLQKRCPAGKCKALALPEIDPDKCRGCMICARKCPVNAITGEKKMPHRINPDLCIRCGECGRVCKFNAVTGV